MSAADSTRDRSAQCLPVDLAPRAPRRGIVPRCLRLDGSVNLSVLDSGRLTALRGLGIVELVSPFRSTVRPAVTSTVRSPRSSIGWPAQPTGSAAAHSARYRPGPRDQDPGR